MTLQEGKFENSNIDETFDVITMVDVIEHVPDPQDLLSKIFANLKPDGVLIIHTPNHASNIVNLARLLYIVGVKRPLIQIFASNHIFFFNKNNLRRILNSCGFSNIIIESRAFNPLRPHVKSSLISLYFVALLDYVGLITFTNTSRFVLYAKRDIREGQLQHAGEYLLACAE